jgi:hypothetical protein
MTIYWFYDVNSYIYRYIYILICVKWLNIEWVELDFIEFIAIYGIGVIEKKMRIMTAIEENE